MTMIFYTADIARKDMNEVLTLRAEEQKRVYEESLEKILKAHFDNLSTAIKDAATKGCSSITYDVCDWEYDEFLYEAQIIVPCILEELVNSGYETDFTKESDESAEWYEFYIHW